MNVRTTCCLGTLIASIIGGCAPTAKTVVPDTTETVVAKPIEAAVPETVEDEGGAGESHAGLSQKSPEEVQTLLTAGAVAVDANGARIRESYGTLPGAIKLSDYIDYAASELPADKAKGLVFYCYNKHCEAAPQAARKAKAEGYKNVHVMPAGIKGWTKLKLPVD